MSEPQARPPREPRDLRLAAYVALGMAAGATYVLFDALSESRLAHGTLTGFLAGAHGAVDRTFPIVAGALFGVGVHYLRLRKQLAQAREAEARADALRGRLQKVERDQAVWVLAATVLHELNNPLHALGLALDEMADHEGDEAQRRDLLDRARRHADRALSHLRALRSMRGLGEPEVQRVALDRIADAVAHDVGPLAAEDGLEVSLDCPEPVQASADPAYVRTILENLVDNSMHSLRTGGAAGHITIRVGAEDGRAVVRVADDGPGLDPRVREALFEPLRSTKTQGLGLGLPIARALARAMRGDLTLDDGPSKAFRLELPLRGVP